MYPKDKNHFSAKIIFPKNSNKKAFHVKRTNFKKKMGKMGVISENGRFWEKKIWGKWAFFPKIGENVEKLSCFQ